TVAQGFQPHRDVARRGDHLGADRVADGSRAGSPRSRQPRPVSQQPEATRAGAARLPRHLPLLSPGLRLPGAVRRPEPDLGWKTMDRYQELGHLDPDVPRTGEP